MHVISAQGDRRAEYVPVKTTDFRFPDVDSSLSQDAEWCEDKIGGEWRRFRFHDYAEIYSVPGLYERLFYKTLKCNSPQKVIGLLDEVLRDYREPADGLRALDLGAGNGLVAQKVHELGADQIVGVDIIPEAKMAAERDRPHLYDAYLVADMTALSEEQRKLLEGFRFNCLSCVAALGFGDVPPAAFATSFDLLENPSWVAFNIKESFIRGEDDSGFSRLIRRMVDKGILEIDAFKRYCHRLSSAGERLYYVAMVARKVKELPRELLD